jgi:hypothetical protein
VYTTAGGQVINGTRAPLGPAFGSDGWFINMANSNYNALQTTMRYASGRTEFLAGYTFSKSIDNSSGATDQINPVNYRLSRGLSNFNMTHNVVASYGYELPFDKVFGANRFSSGWQLSGIVRLATGQPITLWELDDKSLLGTYFTGMTFYTADTPNYTPGDLQFNNPRSGKPYFNTALFTPDNLGQLGTANRRFFHGPGLNNFDMALHKEVRLTESMIVQFRAEFFNVFNHAQFIEPTGNIDSSSFGIVTKARDPRIGQLALKFLF